MLLNSVKIIEFGQYIPSPFATLALADLGASVIKVEPPAGDPMRYLWRHQNECVSSAYRALNGGKKIVFLDLKTPSDREQAKELIACADVLIESFRPGVLDRLGLGRDVLQSINSRIVHCALSGFGQNGPLASKAGHDLTYLAIGGALTSSGTKERPIIQRLPIADLASSLNAALTILAALLRREKTDEPCYIDIAMSDVALSWQSTIISESLRDPSQIARGADSDTGGAAYYNIYRSACGRFVSLAAEEKKFWRRFCLAIGREDLITRHDDPIPQTELIEVLQDLFETQVVDYWVDLLADADCCFQKLLLPHEVVEFPQYKARKMIDIDESSAVPLRPSWIDGYPPSPRLPFSVVSPAEAIASWKLP